MKTNVIGFTFILCVTFRFTTCAQTNDQSFDLATNTFSLSIDNYWDETRNEYNYYVWRSTLGDAIPELFPASLDINGNWGVPRRDLQLSVRFRRIEYVPGEAIPAIVILRNLESHSRTLVLTNTIALNFSFIVRCGTNAPLSERPEPKALNETDFAVSPSPPHYASSEEWKARSEKVTVINLNRLFDLNQPGEYSVRVLCLVFSESTQSLSYEVLSGNGEFRIVNKLSPAGLRDEDDWEKQMKEVRNRFDKYLRNK